MFAAVRTVISSAGPILSTMPMSWNGRPWLIPAAVAAEPVANPISQLPAVMAVLMSAPLPISVQDSLPPAPASNQPSPLASMVGLVSVKKPMLTLAGAAAPAPRANATAAAPARAKRRVISMSDIPSSLVGQGTHRTPPTRGPAVTGSPNARRGARQAPGTGRSRSQPGRSCRYRRTRNPNAGTAPHPGSSSRSRSTRR